MRLTRDLVAKQYEQSQKEVRKKEDKSVVFEEDVGDYYMYDTRKWAGFLNSNRSVFDNKDETSINTAPSIFDKTAIFHTKKEDDSIS